MSYIGRLAYKSLVKWLASTETIGSPSEYYLVGLSVREQVKLRTRGLIGCRLVIIGTSRALVDPGAEITGHYRAWSAVLPGILTTAFVHCPMDQKVKKV